MHIRTTRTSTGERMVLLTDVPHGMPDPWVAGYVVTSLRTRRLAIATVENVLEGIARSLMYCRSIGITDLRAHLLEEVFNDDQLSALVDCCTRRVGGGPPLAKGGAHYNAFIGYVLWLFDQPSEKAVDAGSRRLLRESFEKRAAALAPPVTTATASMGRLGLTAERRDRFLRVITPGHPENPFTATSFRNFVLFSLAFCLGLRSGELRGIKVEHLDLRGRRGLLQIVKNTTDDPEDTRSDPAMQKTAARLLPLSDRLVTACEQLIDERETYANARTHPFLFVNIDGDAIGGRGLRAVYQTLRASAGDLGDLINHQLRHDWNDRWNEMVKENGWDLTECLDQQLLAMGWKPGSTMPQLYGRRSRQTAAQDRLVAMQERSSTRRR